MAGVNRSTEKDIEELSDRPFLRSQFQAMDATVECEPTRQMKDPDAFGARGSDQSIGA